MFNFKEYLKLAKYKWLNIFNEIMPDGNDSVLTKSSFNDIITGSLFKIVSEVLFFISSYIIANIFLNSQEKLYTGMNLYGFSDHVSFVNYILPIITIFSLVYVIALGCIKQKSIFHFCYSLYSLISFVFYIFMLIKFYGTYSISLVSSVLILIGVLFGIVGSLFIIIGCFDFCIKAKEEYREAHKVVERTDIKTSTISTDDVKMHTSNINSLNNNQQDAVQPQVVQTVQVAQQQVIPVQTNQVSAPVQQVVVKTVVVPNKTSEPKEP